MTVKQLYILLSGRLHEQAIMGILYYAQENRAIRAALADAVTGPDDKIAVNALWALTWEQIERVCVTRGTLIDIALSTEIAAKRRLSLTLLERMDWAGDDLSPVLLNLCLDRITYSTEKPGIRSLYIKLAYKMSSHYPEFLSELRLVLDAIVDQPLPPSVLCARRNVMKKLPED